jgi:hypothetical protein
MKLTKIATACAALAIAGVGSAHADAFASSYLSIQNFSWLDLSTGNAINAIAGAPGQVVTVNPTGQNFGTANVSLDAAAPPGISTFSNVGAPTFGVIPFKSIDNTGALNTAAPNAPTEAPVYMGGSPIPGSNVYNAIGANTYSYGGYDLTGAVFNLTGTNNPVLNHDLSQAQLAGGPHIGGSSSTLGTNFTFSFIVGSANLATRLSLDYIVDLLARVSPAPPGTGDTARSGVTWNLSIDDTTDPTQSTTWVVAGINKTRSSTSDNPILGSWVCDTTTGLGSAGCIKAPSTFDYTLLANNQYQISINSQLSANATTALPEPDSLALLGIGMIGLAVSSLRKKMAQA